MKTLALAFGALTTVAALPASAQFGAAVTTPKQPLNAAVTPVGGFLGGGSDDCASPEAIGGDGTFAFDATTASTGTDGQNEANCYFFGTTAIDSDVWYEWTATATGAATATTCAGTTTDTKMAVYPAGGCPADGTSITCNDDACGLQSSISWDATDGASYLIQLGTFPGASAGGGTFDVSVLPDPPECPDWSDGLSDNSLGLTAGGDIAMLQYVDCLDLVKCVSAGFGSAANPDPTLIGLPVTVAVYTDDDNDPTNGMTLIGTTESFVSAQGSDTLVSYTLSPTANISGSGWVAVIVHCTVPGQFPVAFDTNFPNPDAWVAGDTTCNLDPNDLTASDVGVLPMAGIGFPASWLLRVSPNNCNLPNQPGVKYCFGGGCPCGNDDPFAGCANSTGQGGRLASAGTSSVALDDMTMYADRLIPGQAAVLFAGDLALNGGNGRSFGDGLRCVGINVQRFGIQVPGDNGDALWGPGLIAMDSGVAGQTRRFQVWYRDPEAGPCGSGFNLTNASEVTYTP